FTAFLEALLFEAEAEIVEIGVGLLPVALRFKVRQSYQLAPTPIFQSFLQRLRQRLYRSGEGIDLRWLKAAKAKISRESGEHEVGAIVESQALNGGDHLGYIHLFTYLLGVVNGLQDLLHQLTIGPT